MPILPSISRFRLFALVLFAALLSSGCQQKTGTSELGTYRMGERVQAGPLSYKVVEASWVTEAPGLNKPPKDRYLLLRVEVESNQGKSITVPPFSLKSARGQDHREVMEDIQGMSNWLGMLRSVEGNKPLQGTVIFDVPVGAYKLVASDGGEADAERYALIDIPADLG